MQTVVANNGNYTVSTCTQDVDCVLFRDVSATCIAGACECSDRLDRSDYCHIYDRNPQGYERVHFVLSFDFPCDAFFASDDLSSSINHAAHFVSRTWDVRVQDGEFNISFSCGSTNAVVSGMVQIDQVTFIAEQLAGAVDIGIAGTDMGGSLTALSVILGRARSNVFKTNTCRSVPPVKKTIEVLGTCVPVACEPEYTLTLNRTEQASKCVKSPSDSDDDDLSDGAIAGIVVGSVLGAVLIIAVVVLLVGSKKTPTQENNKESEPTV